MKETWSNSVGKINFAKCFKDLQATVPQDRFIDDKISIEQQVNELVGHLMTAKKEVYELKKLIADMRPYIDEPTILERIKNL